MGGSVVKNLLARQKTQVRSLQWKIAWRRKWQPVLVFPAWNFHGQRSLADYGPWGCKRVGHDLETKQQQIHTILTDVKEETGSNTVNCRGLYHPTYNAQIIQTKSRKKKTRKHWP